MATWEIKDVSKQYRSGKVKALSRVNLSIEPGLFGLLGPNGAGKTTLMRILATVLAADSGEVHFGKLDWSRPQDVTRNLGYLPQHFNVYKYLTVGEALDDIALFKGIPKAERKKHVELALERANLDADFVEALAELYPTCEAFYFQNCGKLFLAEDVRSHQIEGPDRFIRFGVNVRFFNIEGTEDMLIDTVGMSTLFLPDLQYHFHGMDPNWVVNHAYNAASYILEHDNPIEDGETIDGVADGQMCREIQWKCQYEDALIQPPRGVLDINMGNYASGGR